MIKKLFILLSLILLGCKTKPSEEPVIYFQILGVEINSKNLDATNTTSDINIKGPIIASFTKPLDITSAAENIILVDNQSMEVPYQLIFEDENSTVNLVLDSDLEYAANYTLTISDQLKGNNGEEFKGVQYNFTTINGTLRLDSLKINNQYFPTTTILKDIDLNIHIQAYFSEPLEEQWLDNFKLYGNGNTDISASISENKKEITITNIESLNYLQKFAFVIKNTLTSDRGYEYEGFSNSFYTKVDSTFKFPEISDDELLTKVQEQTFKYFWDFGHPVSGLSRERNTSGETVTSGGSGFGLMAVIVGIERGFITRAEGIERWNTTVNFLLNNADRFHGAWSHWLNGTSGSVIPFSTKDNGGDLVETSYMAMGLLTVRQYLSPAVPEEKAIIDNINTLWEEIEWDWYTQGQDQLYWHWSPNYNFEMNMPIRGWNEALITHVLAASSPTHAVATSVYNNGWALNGSIVNGDSYYGYTLPLGSYLGGPLFFEQYTFLGLNPTNLSDQYANYWDQVVNHTLINYSYCVDNPKNWIGYNNACWGLTASDNQDGYSAHSPTNDKGVITPTAALSSIAFTPEESIRALRYFYYILGDRTWGDYGFYDAFNITENWYASSYLAIDQGPILLMIENHRTGLLWDLFMSCPEVQNGLTNLGFTY